MIDGLRPYPEMKQTGLPWLREVPAHWQLRRIKTLLKEIDRRTKSGEERLLSLRMRRGLVDHHDSGGKPIPAEALVGFKVIEPGQIVMNRMRAAYGLFAVADIGGLVSPDYAVFSLTAPAYQRYLVELFKLPSMALVFRSESKGLGTGESGFLRLYTDRFGPVAIPYPPLDEQQLIVRFLDWHGAHTAKLIRAKKKLIALLSEQKQGVIQSAVTRGFDSRTVLKPSGKPSLRDIPQHWEIRRLRSIVKRIEQGVSPLAEGFLADDGSWGVLKSGCVNRGVFRDKEHKRLRSDFDINPLIVVRLGDLLVCRASGSPSLVGSAGIVRSLRYNLILSDKTFRCIFNHKTDPEFIALAMNSYYYRLQVEQAISGAEGLANNLPLSSLRDFFFAVPPISEAQKISSEVHSYIAKFETATTRLEHEISLIQEFRARLVSDVVTGKLDVTAAAACLPDSTQVAAVIEPSEDEEMEVELDQPKTEELAA